jgi:hypothetical protein
LPVFLQVKSHFLHWHTEARVGLSEPGSAMCSPLGLVHLE